MEDTKEMNFYEQGVEQGVNTEADYFCTNSASNLSAYDGNYATMNQANECQAVNQVMWEWNALTNESICSGNGIFGTEPRPEPMDETIKRIVQEELDKIKEKGVSNTCFHFLKYRIKHR